MSRSDHHNTVIMTATFTCYFLVCVLVIVVLVLFNCCANVASR